MTARRLSYLLAAVLLLALGAPLTAGAAPATAASQRPCREQTITWKHGVAIARVRGITCARAKYVVKYALNHGLLEPSGNPGPFFALRHRHLLGFTFTADPREHTRFHARKRAAEITFNVCWLNVDC